MGLVTLPAVKTYRSGTRLLLGVRLLVAPPVDHPTTQLRFASFTNPVRGHVELVVAWPREGRARVALYDTGGRRVRTLWEADAGTGDWRASADLGGLAPGIYLVRAEQAGESALRKLVLLR